jgi:hypothetical protein
MAFNTGDAGDQTGAQKSSEMQMLMTMFASLQESNQRMEKLLEVSLQHEERLEANQDQMLAKMAALEQRLNERPPSPVAVPVGASSNSAHGASSLQEAMPVDSGATPTVTAVPLDHTLVDPAMPTSEATAQAEYANEIYNQQRFSTFDELLVAVKKYGHLVVAKEDTHDSLSAYKNISIERFMAKVKERYKVSGHASAERNNYISKEWNSSKIYWGIDLAKFIALLNDCGESRLLKQAFIDISLRRVDLPKIDTEGSAALIAEIFRQLQGFANKKTYGELIFFTTDTRTLMHLLPLLITAGHADVFVHYLQIYFQSIEDQSKQSNSSSESSSDATLVDFTKKQLEHILTTLPADPEQLKCIIFERLLDKHFEACDPA